MSKDRDREGRVFSGRDARQGEIILRTRARRIIFIAGLVGIVLLALVLSIALP
ncbi:peptide ABC transporter permease [Mesorhizobium sp. M1C.F.Ca.ET.193.01.1.1]|uniref:peptide ABC transporter permease n=1 Tax=unclassified Mesorhizobium TaxID=325217 RepID=UPI000FD1A98D|nr:MULTISPECIES: peptide ABC transporter permease [unclassified Mesorhizobium]TGS98266.1 peptide ABC transporter permease [bacterium M00.F.Ca.ET.177.01.1.1]TGQ52631.1 peptide ABC transporter permease [Mesorhizobium sp. M1C.F.Ca.ET.210.01.1.1]TGQ70046.1 peptide ABC transporter permease [Mesorhizobium sp. M1C.F.Ca.ET.212.01.1.1]TGR05499.1 peptide ABC transporter permease [Mesorhizobium sp. M1C.F.Ca.ET.204.01.1.1]TGR26282.1 peptide ABC transporter permease [Mesorhizobium sp. M1C.F.Ca.ET.196.01.1.